MWTQQKKFKKEVEWGALRIGRVYWGKTYEEKLYGIVVALWSSNGSKKGLSPEMEHSGSVVFDFWYFMLDNQAEVTALIPAQINMSSVLSVVHI